MVAIFKWLLSDIRNIIVVILSVATLVLISTVTVQSFLIDSKKKDLKICEDKVISLENSLVQCNKNIDSIKKQNQTLKAANKKAEEFQNLINNMTFKPPEDLEIKPKEGEDTNVKNDPVYIYNSIIDDFNNRVRQESSDTK